MFRLSVKLTEPHLVFLIICLCVKTLKNTSSPTNEGAFLEYLHEFLSCWVVPHFLIAQNVGDMLRNDLNNMIFPVEEFLSMIFQMGILCTELSERKSKVKTGQ